MILYMELELEVPKIQNDKNKSVTKACLMRFNHCDDLSSGRIVKESSNITKYSPEDGDQSWKKPPKKNHISYWFKNMV